MKHYIFGNPDFESKDDAIKYLFHGLPYENARRYRHSNAINEVDSIIFSFNGKLLAELVVEDVVAPTDEDIADWDKTRKVYLIGRIRIFRDQSFKPSDFELTHSQFGTRVPDEVYTQIIDRVGGFEEVFIPSSRDRRHFIIKHGLDAFEALPGSIWRTGAPRTKVPPKFSQVKIGDRWIEFAYIKDEVDREPCSLVTGFYECTREAWHGTIPRNRAKSEHIAFSNWDWDERAWMIEGKPFGEQPRYKPVSVPPINEILDRRVFGRGAIIPGLSAKDFERIRKETLKRQLNPTLIPLLQREPLNEQEVLSIVVAGHADLGIEKITNVQCGFPDMLVKIGGKEVYLELEVDSLGFWHHFDDLRRIPEHRNKRQAKLRDQDDNRPVAILCWVDGDKDKELKKHVRNLRVYELQSLLRGESKIELP